MCVCVYVCGFKSACDLLTVCVHANVPASVCVGNTPVEGKNDAMSTNNKQQQQESR